jgi:serine protease
MIRVFRYFWLSLALALATGVPAAERNPVRTAAALSQATESARVIVRFRSDADLLRRHALAQRSAAGEAAQASSARAAALGQRVGVALSAGRALDERTHVMRAVGMSSRALADRLAREPDVEFAVVDGRRRALAVPNDPLYASGGSNGPAVGQWYLKAPQAAVLTTGNEVVASLDAPAAWDLTTGSASIVVAVLDTGVRPEHPDLASQLLAPQMAGQTFAGYDFVDSAPNESVLVANDGNGGDPDASDPGDWVTTAEVNDKSSVFYQCVDPDSQGNYVGQNSSWHGTMTASLIAAATNNGIGMAGVAWGVKLLPVRVLGKCFGYDSDILAGMQWAAGISVPGVPDNAFPARVLNLSLGGDGPCNAAYTSVVAAVNARGAVVVGAAGNGTGHAVGGPANCPGVIAVAGVRHIGTKVGYSDIGPEVALSAPAGNCVNTDANQPCLYPILAATNTGTTTPVTTAAGQTYTDSFNVSVGTSFSAPLVSGAVALMLSASPAMTPAQVKAALQGTARAFPFRGAPNDTTTGQPIPQCQAPDANDQSQCYCTSSTCGAGMLDTASAVAAALGLQPRIAVSPGTVVPGSTVTMDSSGTTLAAGRTLAAVQWTLLDGGGIVTGFSSADNAATATVTPSAVGSFSVRLTVTDSQGLVASADTVVSVAAAAVAPPPASTSTSSGGGGGGGALTVEILLLLALAIGVLWQGRRGRDRGR